MIHDRIHYRFFSLMTLLAFFLLIVSSSFATASESRGGCSEDIRADSAFSAVFQQQESLKRDSSGTPKVAAQKGKGTRSKNKTLLFLVGGAVVLGGAAALLLLSGGEKTGSIQVSSTPSGAQVFLDGVDTGQVSNCTLSDIDEGSHTVRLVKDGYGEVQQSVTVVKKETANVSLTLAAHTITVTHPTAAAVWAKGRSVSITWTTGGGAAAQAQLRADMRAANVTGMSGSAARMNRLRMHRSYAARGSRISSRVAGRTSRAGVDVAAAASGTEAQVLRGNTPRRADQRMRHFPGAVGFSQDMESFTLSQVKIELLRAGSVAQTIATSASNSGSANWTVPASIQDGTNYKVRVSCATDSAVFGESAVFTIADTGSLRVNSTPSGATIWIDGVNRGVTNKMVTGVPTGQHTLKLTKERFADWQQTVTIKRNQTTTVNAALEPGAFTEDFNDNQAQFWVKGEGQAVWTAQSGVYKSRGGGLSVNTSYYNLGKFSDRWIYEGKGKIDKGQGGLPFGLAFGGTDDFTSYFCFLLSPGHQQWSIWKIEGPNAKNMYVLKYWSNPETVVRRTDWNTIRIVASGTTFRFLINDAEVYSMSINDFPESGKIGIVTTTSTRYDEFHFDDVSFSPKEEGFALPGAETEPEPRSLMDFKRFMKYSEIR